MRELENLAGRLKELVRNLPSDKVPGWLGKWVSPWKGKVKGGELIRQGEEELYQLGIRVRERFPTLFEEDYHPDVYTIRATQVSWWLLLLFLFWLKMFLNGLSLFVDSSGVCKCCGVWNGVVQ